MYINNFNDIKSCTSFNIFNNNFYLLYLMDYFIKLLPNSLLSYLDFIYYLNPITIAKLK